MCWVGCTVCCVTVSTDTDCSLWCDGLFLEHSRDIRDDCMRDIEIHGQYFSCVVKTTCFTCACEILWGVVETKIVERGWTIHPWFYDASLANSSHQLNSFFCLATAPAWYALWLWEQVCSLCCFYLKVLVTDWWLVCADCQQGLPWPAAGALTLCLACDAVCKYLHHFNAFVVRTPLRTTLDNVSMSSAHQNISMKY